MLQSYLQIALRNLRRNGRYLVINALGLGCTLGFVILAYLNYRFAHSFDLWHRDGPRIGRVEMRKTTNGEWYGVCPGALALSAKTDIPAVESSLRYDVMNTVVKRGDLVFNENLYFSDPHFFSFFDFEPLTGVADLGDPNKVVISEEMAQKYFGQENPIGQTLIFNANSEKKMPLTVGAVVKNLPFNSSIRFGFLTQIGNAWHGKEKLEQDGWKRSVGAIFLRLKAENAFAAVAKELQAYRAPRNTARPDWQVSEYRLTPLHQLAHESRFLNSNVLWDGVPPAAVWGNLVLAALLLLAAALNFSNMTISISNRRLREMGVRKVMGGTRNQLMRQLLVEAGVVVVVATMLGMVFAYPLVDWYNHMWRFIRLKVDYQDPTLLAFLGAAAVGTTLLAGSYPAFYLSGFQAARIFRTSVSFGGKSLFSRAMLGLQMAISVLAMVAGFSFAHNAERNRHADIGFDYQPVLQAWLPKVGDYAVFEAAIRDIPGIERTAPSLHLPYFGSSHLEFSFQEKPQEASILEVGNGFTELMNMRLAAGAWPLPAGDTTASPEVVLNESLLRQLGLSSEAIIGQNVRLGNQQYRVVGIVRDFMTDSPFHEIAPRCSK